jgi:uncharacterized surface protein with fasciclin (FAS1) repeats
VAGESLSAADLAEAGSVTSVQGGELGFTTDEDGALIINGNAAMATCWNITTANATVHVIDRVLTPPGPKDCFVSCSMPTGRTQMTERRMPRTAHHVRLS